MAKKKDSYSASDISVLEGLEPVRKRPGMYIGSTGPDGLHHLISEIFDNSRDEAMGGFATRIEVALLPNNRVRVADDGRGIPVDKHPKTKVSALETIMTTLHAGGKFGGEDSGYKVSGGLHGVGASVVNALSTYTMAEVHKGGDVYRQEYNIGKKKGPVKKVGKTKNNGSIIAFEADPEIFKEIKYDFKRVVTRLRQQAYLVKGIRIVVIDAREVDEKDIKDEYWVEDLHLNCPSQTFYFEGGLHSLVVYQNQIQKPIHKNIFYVDKEIDDIQVEIAFQYVDDISSRLTAFANNIHNPEGGMHVTGFKTALTRNLNTYGKKNNIIKSKDESFTGDDVFEGLTAVISIKMPEIQFEGQTKAKLGSPEARGAVETVFGEALQEYLEEHPDDGKAIIQKAILAVKARKAAKAAKDSVLRKGVLEGMTLPGKLADCQSRSADESELFIVEGDSAGGTAKVGRDRRTQAVLPLRGKILNVERARLDRMLSSEQIKNIVIALGTAIGDTFDLSKLRYGKIILATDADVDGAHIDTLLLTLFYRYFRPLLENGHIYIAQSPLFKVKIGKQNFYAYSDEERDQIMRDNGVEVEDDLKNVNEDEEVTEEVEEKKITKKGKKATVQRYKGLGEMNADELKETTMDRNNRILKQVNIEDGAEADKVFDMLMGKDVPARKSFITTNAMLADIDI